VAKQVITAAYLALSGTDYSSYCSKIELSLEFEEKDTTTFGSSGWKENLLGLGSASLAMTFKQDVAAAAIDATLSAIFFAKTAVTFEVRMNSSAVSTSNPKYTGSVTPKEWKPISGSVGDVAEVDITWSATGAVSRATA
jgi:hypothetical protein